MRRKARRKEESEQEGKREGREQGRARKGGEGYCSACAVESRSGDNQTYPVVPMSLRLEL